MSTEAPAAVRKSVTVEATPERAWEVFTERIGAWWPLATFRIRADVETAVLEPREGGRIYERQAGGEEVEWGTVLAYEPPERVLLSWHPRSDWSYDPDPARASEVGFVAEAEDRTRVELEHRHIERHEDPEGVARGVDSPNGWAMILTSFAEGAAG